MKFNEMASVFSDQKMWGAVSDDGKTFIITEESGKYSASAKYAGRRARDDLAGYEAYDSLESAIAACEEMNRRKSQ